MKISKIKISKFHQFEDFELDLTYPKGHEKAGKPLDKVCFIGQSGTGKTTLLEMICHVCLSSDTKSRLNYNFGQQKEADVKFIFDALINNSEQAFFNFSFENLVDKNFNKPIVKLGLYFPAGLTNLRNKKLTGKEGDYYVHETNDNEVIFRFFEINPFKLDELLMKVFEDVRKYQERKINYYLELVNQARKDKTDVTQSKLIEWEKVNNDPLEKISKECLDVLLNKFHLAVKTQVDELKEIDTLQIHSLSDNATVPFEHLSTGTKQIIFTAFPIYQLLEDDSIVLMDEPETSLYPDIQREIIPYYTSFDKNKTSQFFFATHSPIIASAFEPWEIVELKFDEKGKVYRDKYYEGENHVDNYKIDPRYLRWDDILTKVFDMEVDSNAEFRSAKLTEYAILKDKVKSWKEEGKLAKPTKAIEAEVAKFEKMYDLLTGNWAVTRHEKN